MWGKGCHRGPQEAHLVTLRQGSFYLGQSTRGCQSSQRVLGQPPASSHWKDRDVCWLLTVIEGARGAQETGWVCLGEGEMLAPVCPLLLLGHVPSQVQGIETQLLVSPELETPVRYYGGISTNSPVQSMWVTASCGECSALLPLAASSFP